MPNDQPPLVLLKDDYERLLAYQQGGPPAISRQEREELRSELKRAAVVGPEEFPPDAVRIGSRVKVRESSKVMELQLVSPDKANIRERRISVLAPLGRALLGSRKGQQVEWNVPAGLKTFTIIEVINQHGSTHP